MNASWWSSLQLLVSASKIIVDRPRGSRHPRYPDTVYPLDYGFLDGTAAGDGSGIDVWLGSNGERDVVAAVCCVDRLKREIEVKLLLGCNEAEIETIRIFHSEGEQSALVLRPSRAE